MINPDQFEKALIAGVAGDLSLLQQTPKGDLHLHGLLSAPYSAYSEIFGVPMPSCPEKFDSLQAFLDFVGRFFFPNLKSARQILAIHRAAYDQLVKSGVTVAEVSFDLTYDRLTGLSWEELIAAFREIDQSYRKTINLRPELGIARERFKGVDFKVIETVLASGYFKSIDLYGNEVFDSIETFNSFYALARSYGLKIKLHTGEVGNASQACREIMTVRPDAVQHGVHLAEDSRELVKFKNSPIVFNVAPWSNICLNVYDSYQNHPIRKMFDAGLKITIASDDYAIFSKDVNDQYLDFYRLGIFSAAELNQIRLNSLS